MAAVEFALISPVLLLLVAGSLVLGLYLGVSHSVQQLASEAARAAVAGLSAAERVDLARRSVAGGVGSYGLLRPDALTLSAGADMSDPDLFTVTLSYDATSLGLKAFANLLPVPVDRIERKASIRRGGA